MVQRTHGQNTLLFGSQNGLCDECSFKFKQTDLRKRWDNLVVCRDCWEPEHPSQLYNYRARDNGGGVGGSTRTDDSGEGTGTSINGTPIPPSIGAIVITTTSLGEMTDGTPFSLQIETDITPAAPAVWTITAGALPTGLVLGESTGIVSGTPTEVDEAYTLTIQVVDDFGRTGIRAYAGATVYGIPCTFDTLANSPFNSTPPNFSGRTHGIGAMGNGMYMSIGSDSTKVTADPSNPALPWTTVSKYTVVSAQSTTMDVMDDGHVGVLDGGAFTTYDPDLDTWTAQGSLDYAYTRNTGVATPDATFDFISYGGARSGVVDTDEVYGYSIALGTWALLSALPKKMIWGVAVYLGDDKVLVGGGSAFMSVPADQYKYYIHDLSTDTYTATTDIPSAIHNEDQAIQVKLGEKVFLAGEGTNGGGGSNITAVYDIATETWVAGCALLPTAPGVIDGWSFYKLPSNKLVGVNESSDLNGFCTTATITYTEAVAADNPVFYAPMTEAALLENTEGVDGYLNSGVLAQSGQVDGSGYFNGIGAHMDWAPDASYNNLADQGDSLTTEAIVKVDSVGVQSSHIVSKISGGAATAGFLFYWLSTGKIRFIAYKGSGADIFDSNVAVPYDAWVHIAAAVQVGAQSTTRKMWINGAEVATTIVATGSAVTTSDTADDLRIGASGTTPTGFAYGGISNVAIYDSILTTTRVLAHARASGLA